MFNRLQNKKGFTLVELLLVIAVLGIILGISIPRIIANTSSIKLDADQKSAEMAGKKIETMIYLKNTGVIFGDTVVHEITGGEAGTYGEDLPYSQSAKAEMKIFVQKAADGSYTVTVTNGGAISAANNLYQNTGVKPAEY